MYFQRIFVVLMCLLLTSGCVGSDVVENEFHGEEIRPIVAVQDFTLVDNAGNDWNYAEQTDGKVVVVAFLFTNCIDICPIVTENLRWVQSQLTEEEYNNTQFVTITVDPWSDDTTTLSEWMYYRNLTWPHLTSSSTEDGSPSFEALKSVWENFAVGLWIEETPSNQTNTSARHHPDAYSVNHSTGTVLVDSNGKQRVWWGDNDWIVDLVLADIRDLLDES